MAGTENVTRRGEGLRHFILAFLLAIVLYFVAFYLIEHRRSTKGPWEVTFVGEPQESACMVINQPSLGITNVQLRFIHPATNPMSQTIRFDTARPVPFAVPFGECIFIDPTFLPGTVTLRCFGHEIELLPRVLIIDHKEHPWRQREIMVR